MLIFKVFTPMNSLSCFDFTYYRMAFYSTATPKYLSKAGVCILTLVVSLKHWNLYCFFFFHPGTTSQEPFGLYIQAFCTGLDQVLDSYRKSLIDLETQVIYNLTYTVAISFNTETNKYLL